jgi:hypothetical protein
MEGLVVSDYGKGARRKGESARRGYFICQLLIESKKMLKLKKAPRFRLLADIPLDVAFKASPTDWSSHS